VIAVTVSQVKTIAFLVVVVLVGLSVASAWLMKTVAQKAAVAVILALLALLVWTQRSSLDECATKVREGGVRGDTTCSFFGRDVRVTGSSSS
jgi:cobalamin biosynthesis protein CobD/CbiB